MAIKKSEIKTEKIEREYVIPLRERCRPVARYKKTPKAIKTVKEFLAKHMKIRDRDLKKIKLDMYLNEFLWKRGIKKPVHKVKVKAIKEGDIVRVELAEFPESLKYKKIKLERREAKAIEAVKKKPVVQKKEEAKSEEKGDENKATETENKTSGKDTGVKNVVVPKGVPQKSDDGGKKDIAKSKAPKRPQRKVMNK